MSDKEQHVFPDGSKYPITNQLLPVIINNPLPGLSTTSDAHFHNSYLCNYDPTTTQSNTYMQLGHVGNQMSGTEDHPGSSAFSQSSPVYYPSVSHTIPALHPLHVMEGTRTHRIRVQQQQHHHHPYHTPNSTTTASSSSSSSGMPWASIRRRTPPQPEVIFNFNHEPPPLPLVEDRMVSGGAGAGGSGGGGASSISLSHVASNEPPTHLPQLYQTPLPPTPTLSTAPNNDNTDDAAATFAQSAFPVGTPDYARKQLDMYGVLTSGWKLNNEFEPNPDILLRFATEEDGFWRCAFYENGRRCERSLTDRSRQIIEHIRRHIKLEPYVCEGQPCPGSVNGCGRRYSSGDPLRKHRDGNLRGESICDLCGKTLLPGNIMRHRNNSCRETGH